jgi:hypothetical protein
MKRKRLITVADLRETIRKMMAAQRKPKPIVRNKRDRGFYPPPHPARRAQ